MEKGARTYFSSRPCTVTPHHTRNLQRANYIIHPAVVSMFTLNCQNDHRPDKILRYSV